MPYLLCWEGASELGEVSSCPRALRGVWLDVVSREGGPDEGSANEDMLETDGGGTDSDAGFTGTAEPAAARKDNGIFNVAWGLFTTREVTIIVSTPTDNNIWFIISTCSSNVISCYKCSSSLKLGGFWLLKLKSYTFQRLWRLHWTEPIL